MSQYSNEVPERTIGIDLGDRKSRWCWIDRVGEIVSEGKIATTPEALGKRFRSIDRSRMVIENGTHSRWVKRELERMGHEVVVANPRKVRLISHNEKKCDRLDPILLARLGRVDVHLLYPVQFRSDEAQADVAVLKARDALVRVRTKLINCIRGTVKATGHRLRKCSAESFVRQCQLQIPLTLRSALEPLFETIQQVNQQIKFYDRKVEHLCQEKYPETEWLMQVTGVGSITALAYVLVIEKPERFARSRQVGPFLGLTPRQDQSGEQDPQLRITKAGNSFLRRLLVNSAQYVMHKGPECDLRNAGARIALQGGKRAKKRAVVAVTRRLSVLLHHLWANQLSYDPHYNRKKQEERAKQTTNVLAFDGQRIEQSAGVQVQGTAPLRSAPAGERRRSVRCKSRQKG